MGKTAVITARIDSDTMALVDRIAAVQGRSRAWFVAQAVKRFVETEADFLEFVQTGIKAADRGELVAQDKVERWFSQRKAHRHAGFAAE